MMEKLHTRGPEHKISAEVDSLEQAMLVAEAGIDIVQCEKFACELLAETVGSLRAVRDDIVILAAGGINGDNAAQFAATGVDVLVTSWPYFGKPADIKVYNGKITYRSPIAERTLALCQYQGYWRGRGPHGRTEARTHQGSHRAVTTGAEQKPGYHSGYH